MIALNSEMLGKPNVYPLSPPLLEFEGFPKIPRLAKLTTVITEKLDGTNGAVGIMAVTPAMAGHRDLSHPAVTHVTEEDGTDEPTSWIVYAQSRKRLISPEDDNYGFATWVHDNAPTLVADLGPGLHFGEWWGNGIQRGYGQRLKFFSLFNTGRWFNVYESGIFTTPNLRVVPLLEVHQFDPQTIEDTLEDLMEHGSYAAPFMNPEGIVIFMPGSNIMFKKTERDTPKGLIENELSAVA